ncbi:MAG: hypothetical protein PHV75_08935 [Victivallaceae bacterium]|nr:hypothetical protein [Victivallaceae bacterium]MDD3703553.1 hypothetical protein [Victivallaceae bacterium]MDD4318628.1 hypothetical protein [Victivallaceae bacterium]MDD5664449.1 hypothetical protein [Victivallaceae bacterium]NLK83331.1 hypothetical protein [Lentisphaerota bacterium]
MISKYAMMLVGAGMIGLGTIVSAQDGENQQKQERRRENRESHVRSQQRNENNQHGAISQRDGMPQQNPEVREANRELMKLIRDYKQSKAKDQDTEKSAKLLEEIKSQIAKIQKLRINEAEKRLEQLKAQQAENAEKMLKNIEEGKFPPQRGAKKMQEKRNAPDTKTETK